MDAKRWMARGGLLGLLVVMGLSFGCAPAGDTGGAPPTNAAPTPTVTLTMLLPKDAIPSLDHPPSLSVAELGNRLSPQSEVMGVAINGEARAYPLSLLHRHEIINDTVGGSPVAVTFCPLCLSGVVYGRQVEGQTLTFGFSGKIAQNALVMYDHQTGSLWGQALARAVEGPLTGTTLPFLPATQTTWSDWVEAHPETTVVDPGETTNSVALQQYQALANGQLGGMAPDDDPRANLRDYVVGVRLGDAARAYPLGTLRERRVINDVLGGIPIAVIFDPTTAAASVWERPSVNGEPLTFQPQEGHATGVADDATGTAWSPESGKALEGPLAGEQLKRLEGDYFFAVSWVEAHPETDVFGLEVE